MAHILTPGMGKISAVARHARGSRRRFPAALDLFDRGSTTLGCEKSGILALKSFTPIHSLITLRRDLDKLSLASAITESFDLAIPEGDTTNAAELFQLFDLALNAVNEAGDLRGALKATAIACLRLGALSGYLPAEETAPSAHALKNALIAVERFSQRKLLTKTTVFEVIERFSKQVRA